MTHLMLSLAGLGIQEDLARWRCSGRFHGSRDELTMTRVSMGARGSIGERGREQDQEAT